MKYPNLLLAFLSLVIYFFPVEVAIHRRHHNSTAIFVLTLFLGWTVIGWIGSLIWASTVVLPTYDGRDPTFFAKVGSRIIMGLVALAAFAADLMISN